MAARERVSHGARACTVTCRMRKVLIANRGEIAVRVIRACRDAGLAQRRDLRRLRSRRPARAARRRGLRPRRHDAGRDLPRHREGARHRARGPAPTPSTPATASSSENAAFAQAVIDAGLTWIGPPPAAIDALGDKVKARHIAAEVGAPLAPGTPNPVDGVDEVLAFADEYGLPIAIKAAFGGGGRGLKVARNREEIPELLRQRRARGGRRVRSRRVLRRALPRQAAPRRDPDPRRPATATSSSSAPATARCSAATRRSSRRRPRRSSPTTSSTGSTRASKAIAKAAGYVGAGTCEFLVAQDGTISFLEVNTRLQVEHPVTEETSGVDLVRAQFAIADGEPLDRSTTRRRAATRSSSGSTPRTPAAASCRRPATSRPGSRRAVPAYASTPATSRATPSPGAFDSLLAKLIVTGATRAEAIERLAAGAGRVRGRRHADDHPVPPRSCWTTRRSPSEPFCDPHPLDRDRVDRLRRAVRRDHRRRASAERERITVEVGGRRLEVSLPGGLGAAPAAARRPAYPAVAPVAARRRARPRPATR